MPYMNVTGRLAAQRSRWLALPVAIVVFLSAFQASAVSGPASVVRKSGAAQPSAASAAQILDPAVIDALARDESPAVIVKFRGSADLGDAAQIANRDERARHVYASLTDFADRAQSSTLQRLRSQFRISEGSGDIRRLWIANSIAIRQLSTPMLAELQASPDVESIQLEEIIPAPIAEVQPLQGPQPSATVASLTRVKVPEVWALGHRGEGLVIANIDTGVRFTHEALVSQYRGSLAGGGFSHEFNWYDPYNRGPVPITTGDHGTHVIGTMVGDNGSSQQIGAAPSAKWVNCLGFGGFNASASTSGLLECGQWMIAPTASNGDPSTADPSKRVDVVNNSWVSCGISHQPFYDNMIRAWNAAGIASTFAAGNNTNCNYAVNPPLRTVGSPASSGFALAVGSTGNQNGAYAPHSNKGPTTDPSPGLPYAAENFGYADTKPNVVAPGVDIVSALISNDQDYGTMTGTSMSSPLVGGVIGLLWDAAPCLRGNVARTSTLLMESARRIAYSTGSPSDGPGNIPNQATGWGEIDALNAVTLAQAFCANGAAPSVGVTMSPAVIMLEDVSRLTVTLTNYQSASASLTADFVNNLPADLVLAAAPDAVSTCSDGSLVAEPGASSFTLSAGSELPAAGTPCSIAVNVSSTVPANYTYTVPVGALQTSQGSNAYMARAKLKAGHIFPEPYCANDFPFGLNPITKVLFGGINNASSATTQPANQNFLAIRETLQPGNSLALRVEGNTNASGRHHVVAYIDWNQDNVFHAGNEAVVLGEITGSTGLDGKHATADIHVPADALPGPTRMRVIMRTSGASLACSRAHAGSAEDYTVVVGTGTSAPTLAMQFNPAHTTAGSISRLTLTLSNKDNDAAANLTTDLINNLPAGVSVAATTNASSTCVGAPVYTSASSVGLGSGASIPANGSCTVGVDVLASNNGQYNNRISVGGLQTTLGQNGVAATANLRIGFAYPQPYCPVEYYTAVVPITKVQFAGINNASSSAIMTGFPLEDFTAQVANVVPGDLVPLRVEFSAMGAWENMATAYVDWNQNHVFDADEAYPLGGLINSTGTDGQFRSINIPVPLNAPLGSTRLRIAKHWGGWDNACNINPEGTWNGFGGDGYGQAEDYTVTVSAGLAAPRVSNRFTPAMGLVNTESQLATTLSNVTDSVATLTAPFIDAIPTGLEVLNASTSCAGALSFTASSVTLAAGATVPATGSCEILATVRANTVGNYENEVGVGDLVTSLGANLAATSATFKVSGAYAFPEPYCPTFFQFAVYPITRVAIAGIDNRTSDIVNGSPAHENYVSMASGNLSRGGTYPLIVEARTMNTNDGSNSDQLSAFVDWNMDGVFAADETIFLGHLQLSTGTDGQQVRRDIVVPANTPLGPKRMRISKMFNEPPQACRMVGSGQAEDYTLVIDDLSSTPQASIDPVLLALTARADMSASVDFDIANAGRGLLSFDILEAFNAHARNLAAQNAEIEARRNDPSLRDADARLISLEHATGSVAEPVAALRESQMAQMQDNTPVSGNGVACTVGTNPGATRDSSWWRRFYFSEHPLVGASTQIDAVTIASERGPVIPVTINVYTMPRSVTSETIDTEQLTLIGSGRGSVGGTLALSRIALYNTVVVDTNANDLVVEYHIDGSPYAYFLPGGNATPQSHRSFISSNACGIPNPVSGESLGFDEFRLVMIVDVSDADDVRLGCGAPSIVPWLSTNPASGIVSGQSSQTVTVTATAPGLALGKHTATLCVDTNDAANPRFEIPVSLDVIEGDRIFVEGFDADAG